MGNRAVITTKAELSTEGGIGIYLHWNGGRDSVEAFLKYCELKGYRPPSVDSQYGLAYLVGVITNYFGDGLSVGIDSLLHLDLDNGDNGVYVIDGWEIVDREYFNGVEQSSHNLYEMLKDINNSMPKKMQIGCDKLMESLPFTDDEEKMVDFMNLTKEEFLESYSYLTETEYDATVKDVMKRMEEKIKGN